MCSCTVLKLICLVTFRRVSRLEAALTNVLPLIQGGANRVALPTPAPSPSSSSFQALSASATEPSTETTRHLARVATVPSPSLDVKVTPQQRVVSSPTRFSSPRLPPSSTTPPSTTSQTPPTPSLNPLPPRPISSTPTRLFPFSTTCTHSTSRRSALRRNQMTNKRWTAQTFGCNPSKKPGWRLIVRW